MERPGAIPTQAGSTALGGSEAMNALLVLERGPCTLVRKA